MKRAAITAGPPRPRPDPPPRPTAEESRKLWAAMSVREQCLALVEQLPESALQEAAEEVERLIRKAREVAADGACVFLVPDEEGQP